MTPTDLADLATLPDPYPIVPLDSAVDATVRVPGSKSITNRALVCAALADGISTLDGVLFADDTEAMLDCLDRLGFDLEAEPDRRRIVVRGSQGRVPEDTAELDARLSGTTARFVAPLLGLGRGPYGLDGAPPLRARPMGPGLDALRQVGVDVGERGAPGHLPITVGGGHDAVGRSGAAGAVRVRGDVSSQFASGLLLVGPSWPGGLQITLEGDVVSQPYLDMTGAIIEQFGARVDRPDERTWVVSGGTTATRYRVEPDASAASYFFAAAAITGGRVRVDGLGSPSLQGDLAFVDVLEQMGATVERAADHTEVRGSGRLHGVTVDLADLSDTAQTLAAVAVFADTPTEVTGIGFIRRKETDRIAAVVAELRRCGIEATETDDGFRILPGPPHPAVIETYDDHRMAMSFALLGLQVPGIEIADPACVAKTYPGYWTDLERLRGGPAPAD